LSILFIYRFRGFSTGSRKAVDKSLALGADKTDKREIGEQVLAKLS
jgi:hypothetical protein